MTLLYCFDNFYYDPDAVREYALSLEYESLENIGIFPGSRTENLHKIDQNFFHQASSKLFGMFTDDTLDWCVKMTFQKIWNYSDDKESNLNKGWIHKDSSHMAAVVYLDPDPDPDSGTSFYALEQREDYDVGPSGKLRNDFFNYKSCDVSEYERVLINNNSHFNKIGEIKNVYNRIIIYDASTYHAQSNCWSKTGMRLTQPFFMNCLTPVEQRPLWLKGIGYPATLL